MEWIIRSLPLGRTSIMHVPTMQHITYVRKLIGQFNDALGMFLWFAFINGVGRRLASASDPSRWYASNEQKLKITDLRISSQMN